MSGIFSLAGKKILITGASRGIGRATSISCASNGAEVHITARNEEKLKETIELTDGEDSAMYLADLSSTESIANLVDALPQLDGIVLNAGIVKTMPARFIKEATIEAVFDLNIKASILLVKQLLKAKKIKNNGAICFISSIASKKMTVGNAVYSASKGAVNSFAKSLALELAPKGIRVNAILPGMIQTDILNDSAITDENLQQHLKNYPIGRFGKPEDVSSLVVYLLSDASSWMTGSLITLDGGYSIN